MNTKGGGMKTGIPVLAIWLLVAVPLFAAGGAPVRGKAKVAVIQVDGGKREDAFLAKFNIDNVRPLSEEHLARQIELFERAGEMGADIVCGPEDMQNIGAYGLHMETIDPENGEILFRSLAVSVPGPLTDRFAAVARKHSMYVLAPIYEREGDNIFNTTVIFNRQGEIIGKHRKTHLPIMETWLVTPGDSYDTFDTDFGRIAVATCWEIIFPEITSIYSLKGADIVFHPTMGRENEGGGSLSTAARYVTRCRDNFIHLAPVITGTDGNGILDFNGKVLAEAVGEHNTVIMTEIDFSKEPLSRSKWWNTINGTDNEKAMVLLSRNPSLFGYLAERYPEILDRYRDIRMTNGVGKVEMQVEAMKAVDYGP